MTQAWQELLREWITPELTLDGWQERIALIEQQECAYLASLPYVKGIAVIGSVGRGTPWPISDIDVLVVADRHMETDPEPLIRTVEKQCNERLHANRIPNDVEAGNWVLLSSDVVAAVEADRTTLLKMVDHPHWIGTVVKSNGARVFKDFDGRIRAFLDRCESIIWENDFIHLWLRRTANSIRRSVAEAKEQLYRHELKLASERLLLASQEASWGLYASWRRLPQSISRGVTRLLRFAAVQGEEEMGEAFLRAARLNEADVWDRVAALPERGERERKVWLGIRKGSEEVVDELSATRDFLQLNMYLLLRSTCGPHAAWTGVSDRPDVVEEQLEAVEELLERLEMERAKNSIP